MTEIKNINLPDSYFKNGLKSITVNFILMNSIGLILFFAVFFYLFYNFYSNFEKEYKLKVISNFNREIMSINNEQTSQTDDKEVKIARLIKEYVKDKYINYLWISSLQGKILFHSNESLNDQQLNLKNSNEYGFIFQHNWSFNPDGSVIPLIKDIIYYEYTELFFPVYNLNKKIDYIIGINFKKYLVKIVYIPSLKIYVNLLYIMISGLCLAILFIILLLIIFFSKIKAGKEATKNSEFLSKIQEFQLDQLPFQFSFNEERFKNNYSANLVKYINQLLEKFNIELESRKNKEAKIKKVIPPAIFDSSIKQKNLKIIVKPDEIDLKQFIWGLYSKNKEIKLINGYSTGIYHYHKEKDSDLIFNYFDISPNKKGFFAGKIQEPDVNKKILILSLLNFMFNSSKKNILSADGYLSDLNSSLFQIGHKELKLHASYIILNTSSNYIEIASTRFSPLINYKTETAETAYYEFNSMGLGEKPNEIFSKNLKKESFQLSYGDIIVLPDPDIENAANFMGEIIEIRKIADTVHENKSASADVLADKIKETMNQFSIDYSKSSDLFALVIKRNLKHE